MSVYALPSAVWGGSMPPAETTPTETTVETTAETTVETTAETTAETTVETTSETTVETTEETTVETTEETTAETTETTEEDDFGIEPFSLLPLDETYATVTLDRRSSIPSGLADKPMYSFYVYEALQEVLERERIIPKGGSYTGKIVYAIDYDDSYKSVGWNDIISLDEDYIYDSTESIHFILGDDQLDLNNKKFDIEVNFMCFDRSFIEQMGVSIYNKAGKVDIIRREVFRSHRDDGTIGVGLDYTVLESNFEENEKPGLHIYLPDGYSGGNVRIYSGSRDITSGILGSTPYSANQYSNDLTFVFTRGDGSKVTLPVEINIYAANNHVSLSSADRPYDYESFYSSPVDDDNYDYIGNGVIYDATSFDGINTLVDADYYNYIDYDGTYHGETTYIDFACIGKYSSKEEALGAGADDIKESLFSADGTRVKLSPDTERTAYTYDGAEVTIRSADITVIDTYGIVYNETWYCGISEDYVETPSLSNNTYFSISGANRADGSSLRSYKVNSDDDSYYQNGYQTVFLLDKTSPVTPVTNGETIYPEFYAYDDAKIFMNGSPVISETSPVTFNSGTALQYSASSQSGTHLKNYWVTFVTQQTGGAKLFVNATNYTGHYSESGKPQREVFLTPSHDYHHDIFFANIGDTQLQGINVSLSGDAQGIKLDDYWNVIGGSVRTLNPFTETYSPDNIAKVRLVPVSDDYFGPISGTLTISTSNGGSQDIELTGIAGVPKITTDKLYDGVKYVPYSSVIMTNNMYDADAMKFSITSGRLPRGVSLKPNGELYGMPTEVGMFTFTVKAAYVGGTGTFGAEDISSSRTYTITITDNTDENVDAVNTDEQGYELLDRVTRDITVYYSGGTPGSADDPPTVTEIVYSSSRIFRSEGEIGEFLNFYIDGIKLERDEDYYALEGSTKITVRDQTFNNIVLTGEDVPHTLAAEFRTEGGTKDLKRSAQNVYFKYVYRPDGDTPGGNPGSSPSGGDSGGGSSGGEGAAVPTNVSFDTVTAIMTIVDENNEPIPNLSLELRSTPKRATTDDSGNVKFNSVGFGRHTLYVKDSSGKNKTSASFTLVSGLETKVDGNIITARVDGTVRINVLYDGSKLEFRAAETEDVSAAAGASLTDDMIYASISKSDFEVIIMVLILLTASAVSAFAVIRKNKGKNKQ